MRSVPIKKRLAHVAFTRARAQGVRLKQRSSNCTITLRIHAPTVAKRRRPKGAGAHRYGNAWGWCWQRLLHFKWRTRQQRHKKATQPQPPKR